MPGPAPTRDPFRDAIADTISEFAKCLIVVFVFPPTFAIAAMCLLEMVR